MRQLIIFITIIIFSQLSIATEYKLLLWDELIPEAELEVLKRLPDIVMNPHQPLDPNADIRDEINSAMDQIMDPELQSVMTSINVREELNNQVVSIAGFIVPVETDENNAITEFFLVPYFGACIHVPPPPPNQIVYVRYRKGLQTTDIWMPYEIKGTLFTEMIDNDIAISAYTFDADEVVVYRDN